MNRSAPGNAVGKATIEQGESMLFLRRPRAEAITEFLARQSKLDFTYSAIGATATVPPAGYAVDHTRFKLGEGENVFASARVALHRWDHFRLGGMEALPQQKVIEPGVVVAVLAHKFGLWWLNACRIVYVVDEPGPTRRFGFAYGTLPDHVETGEERFMVEWDQATDEVWYDILAFSRAHHPLARLGARYARRVQKRFGTDSAAALVRVVPDEVE